MSTLSQLLVAVPFALLGFTAPFGTTILGVVAIGQIKRSKGRLYGMPLAVFDALVFPLIFFDLLVLAAGGLASWLVLILLLGRPNSAAAGGTDIVGYGLVLLLDLLLVTGPLVWLDWRIVRGVWRNATGYQAPPKHAACISATIAADGGEMLPEEGRWEAWWLRRSRATQRVIAAMLALVLVIGLIGFLYASGAAERLPSGGMHTYSTIGFWDPWYRSEWQDGKGGGSTCSIFTGSFLFGVAACISLALLAKIFIIARRRRLAT